MAGRQTGLVMETWQALFVSSLLTTAAILILPELMAGATAELQFFQNCFKCSQLVVENFANFEMQLFRVELTFRLLCALVCSPLKFNKNFIQEFSDSYLLHIEAFGQ